VLWSDITTGLLLWLIAPTLNMLHSVRKPLPLLKHVPDPSLTSNSVSYAAMINHTSGESSSTGILLTVTSLCLSSLFRFSSITTTMSAIKNDVADQRLVLYSDGGAWPVNPGFGGWGLHGYLFSTEAPKKGTGLGKWIVTETGYADKTQYPDAVAVTPLGYFDGFGSYSLAVTNNVGELDGAIRALSLATDYAIKSVLVISDSKYVVENLNRGSVARWEKNNWIKPDGNPAANPNMWIKLLELKRDLEQKGVQIFFQWQKGHTGNKGNDRADHLATLGVNYSHQAPASRNEIIASAPDGYWKSDVERHPFLNLPFVLFTTDKTRWVPNKYYQVTTAKEVDQIGRRARDGSFAIVELDQPSVATDKVMLTHAQLEADLHRIVVIDNNAIHRGEMHDYIVEHGPYALRRRKPHRDDLVALDQSVVSYHQDPALLTFRAIDKLEEYNTILECYKAGLGEVDGIKLVQTDLTPILYETKIEVRKGKAKKGDTEAAPDTVKETLLLKPEYKVGYAKLEVEANYDHDGVVKTLPLSVMLGIDLLDRNSLKRLESHHPQITLLTWRPDELYFSYATIVKTTTCIGIWSGVFTNQRIIPANS
jgi:ribonuclease HI